MDMQIFRFSYFIFTGIGRLTIYLLIIKGSDGRCSGRRLAAPSAGRAVPTPSGLLVVGLSLTVSVDVGPVMVTRRARAYDIVAVKDRKRTII